MSNSSQGPSRPSPEGIPAATIIIFRDGRAGGKGDSTGGSAPEILMTVRSRSMAFAGGMAVFPGGRVDPEDFDLAKSLGDKNGLTLDEAAHQIAAIRETLEETGLALGFKGAITAQSAHEARALLDKTKALAPVLGAFGWALDFDQIVPFARWFPMNEKLSRVYDTRFYLANLGTGAVEVSVDNSENTKLFWTTAQGALDAAQTGEIKLIFPTRRNLERLALFSSFADARTQAEAIPVKTIIPQVDESSGKPMLTIMEDAGYPITAELLETVARG
ncbi:MAG: NUDIX domain-containing protein [Pseudomonadota bacterium]